MGIGEASGLRLDKLIMCSRKSVMDVYGGDEDVRQRRSITVRSQHAGSTGSRKVPLSTSGSLYKQWKSVLSAQLHTCSQRSTLTNLGSMSLGKKKCELMPNWCHHWNIPISYLRVSRYLRTKTLHQRSNKWHSRKTGPISVRNNCTRNLPRVWVLQVKPLKKRSDPREEPLRRTNEGYLGQIA